MKAALAVIRQRSTIGCRDPYRSTSFHVRRRKTCRFSGASGKQNARAIVQQSRITPIRKKILRPRPHGRLRETPITTCCLRFRRKTSYQIARLIYCIHCGNKHKPNRGAPRMSKCIPSIASTRKRIGRFKQGLKSGNEAPSPAVAQARRNSAASFNMMNSIAGSDWNRFSVKSAAPK